MSLRDEIFEQRETLGAVLGRFAEVERVARAILGRRLDFVYIAARGSSDNAGLYAKYLLGVQHALPVALAVPSLFTCYAAPPRLHGALVIGISQSGESPDIVGTIEEARRQGATTLVVTNCPDSPLARTGEFVLDLGVGDEKSVAATKTYTAQLLILAMLSAALGKDRARREALDALPGWVAQTLTPALDQQLAAAAAHFRRMGPCVVLGRGFQYSTVHEWSLKLKELAYVLADPYSSADFQHGPIALIEEGFPVLAVATDGPVCDGVFELCARLRAERGADVLVVTDRPNAATQPLSTVQIPAAPEWLAPILAILPGQLFSEHLARARGLDPDRPRGLRKITTTR